MKLQTVSSNTLFTLLAATVTREYIISPAYENHQITGVDMNKENLNSDKLICYPLIQGEQIKIQNQ